MEITNAEIKIVDGTLTVDGQKITGLFEQAEREPAVISHSQITASLPVEDLTPGHVFPGFILTTSRSA